MALLAVVCAVAVASVYTSQPILTRMGSDLGVPTGALGWLVSAGQLGYLLGLVFLVPLGDVLDRRRLIALHLFLVAAGLLVVAVAPGAWMAFVGITWAGLFAVVVQTTVAYAAAVSAPGERGRTLGFVTAGVVVGILGSRLLAGALTDLWGWRSVYLVLSVLAVVLGVGTLLLLPADRRSSSDRYSDVLRDAGRLFADPAFLSRGLIALFLFASFGTLWSGMASPLSAAPWHLTETQIGLFGLAGLAGALGAGRAGRWADAGHANRVSGIALAVLLASWALIGQLPRTLALLTIGVVVLDFAVQAVHVSNQHVLTALHADRVATAIGGYMAFYSCGSAIGAATTTAVYNAAGWAGSALLGAAFAAAGLLTWALGTRAVRAVRTPTREAVDA
jgi:predicted MFS family arabinose efflux permease